jgi:hypothetical protein
VKRRLDRIPLPPVDEDRAFEVVREAFASREPVPRPRRRYAPAIAIAAVAVAAGVLASPPGRALIHSIRKAVGIEHAATALFSLPARGSLLVVSDAGIWTVQPDGSRRLVGRYNDASWSPFGHYIAATRRDELFALDTKGHVRWTLARPAVRFPAWTGSLTDTRIAFLTTSRLHVVGGDGTGDTDAGGLPAAAPTPPVWRPGPGRMLAYATTHGRVFVYDSDHGTVLFATPWGPVPTKLAWSSDGKQLLALSRFRLRVYDIRGHVVAQDDPSDATEDLDAAFYPGTHQVAVIRKAGTGSSVFSLPRPRNVFQGTGVFRQVVFSPDGRWLLVTWPTANQWVFVRVQGPRKIVAVARIARQFGSGNFPRVAGWCCSQPPR